MRMVCKQQFCIFQTKKNSLCFFSSLQQFLCEDFLSPKLSLSLKQTLLSNSTALQKDLGFWVLFFQSFRLWRIAAAITWWDIPILFLLKFLVLILKFLLPLLLSHDLYTQICASLYFSDGLYYWELSYFYF